MVQGTGPLDRKRDQHPKVRSPSLLLMDVSLVTLLQVAVTLLVHYNPSSDHVQHVVAVALGSILP